MAFYRMDAEDGSTYVCHVNFGRKHGPLPCRCPRLETDNQAQGDLCGRISTALCDAPAGKDLGGNPLTCDKPMCDKHRTRGGKNIDYCDRHKSLAKGLLDA